jgi:hypothetical protein
MCYWNKVYFTACSTFGVVLKITYLQGVYVIKSCTHIKSPFLHATVMRDLISICTLTTGFKSHYAVTISLPIKLSEVDLLVLKSLRSGISVVILSSTNAWISSLQDSKIKFFTYLSLFERVLYAPPTPPSLFSSF